jgi:hypothetical protein
VRGLRPQKSTPLAAPFDAIKCSAPTKSDSTRRLRKLKRQLVFEVGHVYAKINPEKN